MNRNLLLPEGSAIDDAFVTVLERNPGLLKQLGEAIIASLPAGTEFPITDAAELRSVNDLARQFVQNHLRGYVELVGSQKLSGSPIDGYESAWYNGGVVGGTTEYRNVKCDPCPPGEKSDAVCGGANRCVTGCEGAGTTLGRVSCGDLVLGPDAIDGAIDVVNGGLEFGWNGWSPSAETAKPGRRSRA